MSLLTASGRDVRMLNLDVQLRIRGVRACEIAGGAPSVPGSRMWICHSGKHNRMSVIASIDSDALHVSIAHSQRYPTWEEILEVRAWAFHEETEVVMVLARASEYVNIHNNCFHLWESACGREGR